MAKQKLTFMDLKQQAEKYGMKTSKLTTINEVQKFFEKEGIIPDDKINGNWDKITGTKQQKKLKVKKLYEQANKPKKKKTKADPKKKKTTPKRKITERENKNIPYTKEQKELLIEYICDKIVSGKSVEQICKSKNMPHPSTVIRWMDGSDEHAKSIARARTMQSHTIYGEIQDTENKIESGKLDPRAGNVIIHSKQWRAGKMNAPKYGDKLDVTSKDEKVSTIVVGTQKEKDSLEGVE